MIVALSFAVALLCVAVMLLTAGVQRLHLAYVAETHRIVGEVASLRAQLRKAERREHAMAMCITDGIASRAAAPTRRLDYDTWLRERTERAHREFIDRTSQHLPCDWTTEEIARYFGAPVVP